MRSEFIEAIKINQAEFGLKLDDSISESLADYYKLVLQHNPFLHLVAPCSAKEFAVRHVLESLTLLEYLPQNATFADVGTGAGLPSIPCLIVRDDLNAILIESKEKKAKFLETAVKELGLKNRVRIINRQFEEAEPGDAQFVTCRALDRFKGKLPKLLRWSKERGLLFFGGENLKIALQDAGVIFEQKLMPLSEQRFLFVGTS